MGFKVVVGGSARAKEALQTNRCYRTKAAALSALKRLRVKADKLNLYPGSYAVISCKTKKAG